MGTDIYGQFNIGQLGVGYAPGYQLVPGAREIFVRSTGFTNLDPSWMQPRILLTLSAALAQCRSGAGDVVHVLPGHSENVTDNTMLANLVPGTIICGWGTGAAMPTFRWTNTAGNWVLDDSGVQIYGLRLRMEGANGITSGFTVTAADVTVCRCDIEVASGATAKAAIVGTVSTGADRFSFCNNQMRGTATHNVTDGILVSAAVSDFRACDNEVHASATAANGFFRFSAAALGLKVLRNMISNTHTASTGCINVGNVAATGTIADNRLATISTGAQTTAVNGVVLGAGSLVRCFNNLSANDPNVSGMLMPAVDT